MVSEGYAFCVIVRDVELSEEIIAALIEAGASGVTVVNTRGLSKATFHRYVAEVTIAALNTALFTSDKHESLLLFSLVKDEAQVNAFCETVAKAAPNIDRPGSVIHFAVPVSHLRGLTG